MTKDAFTFRYRVRNWSHYNRALIARGGLTFWIDEAALTTWRNTQARLGTGAPRIYSDTAIHGGWSSKAYIALACEQLKDLCLRC
jgi:hypothetical protein